MCLYPKLVLNPRYKATTKNRGEIPPLKDHRVKYVPIGCQRCLECRKQKARGWQIRLMEDIKTHTNGKFITLTFSDEEYADLFSDLQPEEQTYDYDMENAIATLAVKRFRERWRKRYGRSIRHWLVTELGQSKSERIHLHGIVWTNEPMEAIEEKWTYGFVWKGKEQIINRRGKKHIQYINYVNQNTASYITKYVSKTDELHKNYRSIVLTSPGIGSNYTNSQTSKVNHFKGANTVETYRTGTGHKIAMPIYWRNKLYTEKQREQLWLHRLDKEVRYVRGEKVSVRGGDFSKYYRLLSWHQKRNQELGYSGDKQNWSQQEYEQQRRKLLHKQRKAKLRIQFNYITSETLPT